MDSEKGKNKTSLNSIFNIILILIVISIYFIPSAMAANPQIKLTTNRYIILDDPNKNYLSVTANAETGFGLPGSWSTDAWNGESTTIRGVALVLNANGTPASGVTVTFSALDWNDATPRNPLKSDTNSKTNVTNAYGLATVPFNLNNEQQYGRWKITATATVAGTPVSSSSNFVYNWWGCQTCHGRPYTNNGDDKGYISSSSPKISTSSKYDPYSPYITGRDFHSTMYLDKHLPSGGSISEGECWGCHNSYDKDLNLGQVLRSPGTSYSGKGTPSTYGVHTNLACAECHSVIGSNVAGSQTVKSCDAAGCHSVGSANNSNSHIGPETVTATSPNKYVNYSGMDLFLGIRTFSGYNPTPATFNSNPLTGARAHTSATVQNIPCTVCHGPMHNITKPNINTVPKNTITEDTQCTTCHQSLKHSNNNPVYCTACHSQDAHNITVLSKTAASQPSYVFLGSTNAITSLTTDCEQCHASGPEATFFGSLTTVDSAAYSTNFAPATPVHNRHNGTVACTVCHDNTNFHNIKFLQPNGAYSTSNVTAVKCVDCHNGTNSAVRSVVQSKFGSLPPTVNANMNHSSNNGGQKWGNYWTTANGACLYCHGETQHNTSAIGAAGSALGADKVGDPIGTGTVCSSCHNPGDSNYNVVNSLNPKPPANKPGTNYPSSGAVDHSPFGVTDNDCKNCHGSNLAGGENMVGFTHNVAPSGGSGSCDSCHAQPPNGASRYNTRGAHTLHSAAGYGNVAITGCNYCHSTEGANEAGHPGTFNDATVVPNASVTITIYSQNTATGKDDTCSGVSCHTTGLSNGAKVGTATWDNTTAGACNECHSTVPSGLPPTGNHTKHYTTKNYQCATCHGTNADAGTQTGHKTNGAIDISFTGTLATGGSITTGTCTVYCHSPNPNDVKPKPAWNTSTVVCGACHSLPPTKTRNGVTHTTNTNCDICHGTGASTGTQLGHIDGSITTLGGGTTCTICHAQPPNDAIVTDQRNNTDGAHTLHKNAGYGAIAETSCNYCHNNGGNNEGGAHPNGLYNVVTNSSATISLYTQNIANGKDDTCSGVSCHTTGLSNGAKVGTATWNNTTAGACNECHSTVPSGLPPTGNHTKHYTTKNYQCATCHGTNADAGTQAGHKTNGAIDISFTGTLATGGSITSGTCTVYCHSPNPNDVKPKPAWNTSTVVCGACHSLPPTTTRNGATPHAGVTDCNGCHGTGANTGTQNGHINRIIDVSGASCTGCHSNVGVTSLGLHSRLNGTSAVDDGDCQTCHFASFSMVTGAANSSNTHYCQDCHTSAGTGSPKPGILVSVNHGKIDCKWCHAAGDQPASKYHSNNLGSQQGPKGTATGANCATCHGANLQDLFRAPGITHLGDITTCGECHSGANHHLVSALNDFSSPTLSGIPVTTSVTVGAPAQIQATVSDNIVMIAAAQYQVTNTSGTVIPWTNMTSLDGFNSATETVIASIPTSNLIGPYTVSIKGMSSAYKTDPSKPYYPLNGMWSSVSTVQLIVNQPQGYVNGTVKNGTNTIAGAIITTNTGVSAITDSNGNYSLNLVYGSYQLIASKNPEYYSSNSISVTSSATPVIQNMILNKKPTGIISGTVKIK